MPSVNCLLLCQSSVTKCHTVATLPGLYHRKQVVAYTTPLCNAGSDKAAAYDLLVILCTLQSGSVLPRCITLACTLTNKAQNECTQHIWVVTTPWQPALAMTLAVLLICSINAIHITNVQPLHLHSCCACTSSACLICPVVLQTVPYTIWDNTTAKGTRLLTAAHDRLMAYHANKSIELPAGTTTRYPTEAVVALWDPAITWVGGGWSSMKVSHLCHAVLLVHNQLRGTMQ